MRSCVRVGVDAEVAQQRLDEQRRERRVELRVERVEAAGRILPAVVEAEREVAAAPRQQLRAAEVERRLSFWTRLRADQLIGRELGDVVLADGRRQHRPVERADAGDLQVEGLRVQPLDRDLEVVLERERDGLVERQVERAGGGATARTVAAAWRRGVRRGARPARTAPAAAQTRTPRAATPAAPATRRR